MFFQKPFEFQLQVDGESWCQGDPIVGRLIVKSHVPSGDPVTPQVHLTQGTLKKVHARASDAFRILQSIALTPSADGTEWRFQTDTNFPITDSTTSPFLVYGAGIELEKLGQLQLSMKPAEPIQAFLDIVRVRFRFVVKTLKSEKDGGVYAKLEAPESKNFAILEHLVLRMSFEGQDLVVSYEFQLKKFDAMNAGTVAVKKESKKRVRTFSHAEYRRPSGRINDDVFEADIREAFSEVESKIL